MVGKGRLFCMKDYELLDAVGGIDSKYIESAGQKSRRPAWRAAGAIAACLVLAVGVWAAVSGRIPGQTSAQPEQSAGMTSASDDTRSAAHPVAPPTPDPDGRIERDPEPDTWPEVTILRPGDDGYIDPAPLPTLDPSGTGANGPSGGGGFQPNIPVDPSGTQELPPITPIISRFGEFPEPTVPVVPNGSVVFSDALAAAMAQYGDTVNYRVYTVFFRDGEQVTDDKALAWAEQERLSSATGCIVAMEGLSPAEKPGTYTEGEWTYYLTLHASFAQLEGYPANENAGVFLMLYDEYFGGGSGVPVVYNGNGPVGD